jgi:ribokinase
MGGPVGCTVWVVGSLNEDLTVATSWIPTPGATVLGSSVSRGTGGKGANQAVAAARAGARTVMVGAVGRDDAGDRLLGALAAEGIETSFVDRVPLPTGLALITLADDGENSIVVVPGANGSVTEERVETALRGVSPGDVVVAQGEVPPPAIEAAGRCARQARARFVLNLAPVVKVRLDDAGPDVLVVNEHEAALLDPSGEGVVERGVRLCRRTRGAVVITLGGAGALIVTSTGASRAAPVEADAVVDTTGAGDAFVGALAAGLAASQGLNDAVAWGLVAGSVAVGTPGAQSGHATPTVIRRAMQRRRAT